MLKQLTPALLSTALLLSSGVAFAQHIDVGPGGVRVSPGHDEHHERHVIEEHEHHVPVEHHERRVVREHHGPAEHHEVDHDD